MSERLSEPYGGHWGEHPAYPPSEWVAAVVNDETRLGYWAWVEAEIDRLDEQDDEEAQLAAEDEP